MGFNIRDLLQKRQCRLAIEASAFVLITVIICLLVISNGASVRTAGGFQRYAIETLPELKVFQSEVEDYRFQSKVQNGIGVAVNRIDTQYDYLNNYIDDYIDDLEKSIDRQISGFNGIVVNTAVSEHDLAIVSLAITYEITELQNNKLVKIKTGIKTVRFDKHNGRTLVNQQIFMKAYPKRVRSWFNSEYDNYRNYMLANDGITYFFVSHDPNNNMTVLPRKVGRDNTKGWLRHTVIHRWIDPNKPMVALTYDDGPGGAVEERIHKVLARYNGKATFFYSGYMIKGREDNMRMAVAAGHEIGNHTWNHPYLPSCDDKELTKQLDKTSEKIKEVCGRYPTVFRPSYGATTKHVNKRSKLPVIIWDIDTLDWKSKNAKKVYKSVVNNKNLDGSIVLMHCIYPSTAEATEKLVPWLAENGYQMVTVSELLRYKDQVIPEPGKEYHGW